jgi:hypothetical protein
MLVGIVAIAIFASLTSYSSVLREGSYIGLNVFLTLIQILIDKVTQSRPNLDVAFFSDVLQRGDIQKVSRDFKKENRSIEDVGAGGTGTARAFVEVQFSNGKKSKYFVKFPAPELFQRTFLTVFKVYANELNFYANVRDHVPDDLTAKAVYVRKKNTDFVLILEDMSSKGAIFPTILDHYPRSRVELVLRNLARFHAANWNNFPSGVWTDEWSGARNGQGRTRPPFLKIVANSTLKKALEWYPNCMDASVVSSYRTFIENYPILRKFWSTSAPLTMVHGDCHIGNMSFFKNDDSKMWFFDMQCVAAENCMRDIAYHLLSCFNDGELTDEIEEELIQYYLDHLNKHLPESETGMSFEEAYFQYRLHSFWCLTAFVISAGASDLMAGAVSRVVLPRISRNMLRIEASGALNDVLDKYS